MPEPVPLLLLAATFCQRRLSLRDAVARPQFLEHAGDGSDDSGDEEVCMGTPALRRWYPSDDPQTPH